MLDSVVALLPSPLDRPASRIVLSPSLNGEDGNKSKPKNAKAKQDLVSPDSDDTCALAFKVTYDPARGPIVFIRNFAVSLILNLVLISDN